MAGTCRKENELSAWERKEQSRKSFKKASWVWHYLKSETAPGDNCWSNAIYCSFSRDHTGQESLSADAPGLWIAPPCRGSAMMGRQIRTSQNRKHSLCSFSELPAGSQTFYIVLGETVQSQELWSTRIGCPWCLWDIHSWRFSEHIWQGTE